jgi:hypothetical protein
MFIWYLKIITFVAGAGITKVVALPQGYTGNDCHRLGKAHVMLDDRNWYDCKKKWLDKGDIK